MTRAKTEAEGPGRAADLLVGIDAHRSAMLRFARRKIRDADLAEDAVQDALLSAIGALDSFQGQSAFRTWLIGILNHKIQDTFRREGRYVPLAPAGAEARDEAFGAEADPESAGRGSNDPVAQVASLRLGQALHGEIDALPASLREVFRLQVLEDTPTAEVCARLRISEANCWVRLHRARKRLAQRMSPHFA